MKLFISHSNVDLEIAQSVRLRIRELPGAPESFLLSDDIFPADTWELAIRRAATACDAIVCVVTPTYVAQPWFVAEWAAFWIQEKPWYILALGVVVKDVFEPMRTRQFTSLDDRKSVERFLRALTDATDVNFDLRASELVEAVNRARDRQARANGEANMARLATSLASGTDNVDRGIVESILRGGRLNDAVTIAVNSANSVKIRQLAIFLLELGEFDAVAQLTPAIPNRAERRTVGVRILDMLSSAPQQGLLGVVLSIYSSIREPQRRDLREAAERLNLDIDWPVE